MSARFEFPRAELRARTVRGALITGGFLIGIDALVVAQGLIVTRLLGPAEIGLYGIATVTVATITALRRVGIEEAFVAQDEPDQELEFRRAFTLELGISVVFAVVLAALAPLIALAYGERRVLGLVLALSLLPVAMALLAPLWIFFRRMDFARQRSLQAIQPVVAFAVTVPLAATGSGVWSLVIGTLAGYVAAVAAALAVSPYRPALRFDRDAARRYGRFSGWIVASAVAALVIAQGQVIAFEADGGLAAAGFITLAVTLTRYADRADQIVTATVYPAICELGDRAAALHELFVKTNRATLLYVLPFCAAVALFSPDLVAFVLGSRWEPAVVLLQGLAGAAALQQLGYNWFAFYRARGQTRPQAVETLCGAGAFLVLAVPGLVLLGAKGFVAGRIVAVAVALGVRWTYVRRLLPGVGVGALVAPALVPVAAAAAAVLAVRGVLWGGHRSAAQALAEAAVFLAVFLAGALRRERALISELRGGFAQPPATPGHRGPSPPQPAAPRA
jgi:O-antigen/teichoic acid export membrane protein